MCPKSALQPKEMPSQVVCDSRLLRPTATRLSPPQPRATKRRPLPLTSRPTTHLPPTFMGPQPQARQPLLATALRRVLLAAFLHNAIFLVLRIDAWLALPLHGMRRLVSLVSYNQAGEARFSEGLQRNALNASDLRACCIVCAYDRLRIFMVNLSSQWWVVQCYAPLRAGYDSTQQAQYSAQPQSYAAQYSAPAQTYSAPAAGTTPTQTAQSGYNYGQQSTDSSAQPAAQASQYSYSTQTYSAPPTEGYNYNLPQN